MNSLATTPGRPREYGFLLALLLLGLGGYLLPWIVAPSAAMTLNAFDLAEWTSLHPWQQAASPPLILPLLLRSQLPILSIMFVLAARGALSRLAIAGVIALVAAAQLPPFEFLGNLDDNNYRQQMFLALCALILPTLLGRRLPSRYECPAIILLAGAGVLAAVVGQQQAEALLRITLETGYPGPGLFLTVLAQIGIMITTANRMRNRAGMDIQDSATSDMER